MDETMTPPNLDDDDEKSYSAWFTIERCIRGRKHLTRRHGVKYDLYFALRHTFRGTLHDEGEGWASKGMTLEKARADLSIIKEGQRTGKGPFTLQELREREFRKRAEEERERQAAASRKTLAMVWEEYQKENSHKKGLRTDRYIYKLIDPLQNKFPAEIVNDDIDKMVAGLKKSGKSEQTWVHALELVRRLLNYGERKGWFSKPPKFQLSIKIPKIDNIKMEYLTKEQQLRLKEGLDADPDQEMANLMRLALITGMRRNALLGLQWTDINFQKKYIELRGQTAKNGTTMCIPLSRTAEEIFSCLSRTDSPYVFPGKNGGQRVETRAFIKRIKKYLPAGFRPMHGLRQTFATEMISSGEVDLYTLQKLLTQKSGEVTRRYAFLTDAAMKRAASVADNVLEHVFHESSAQKEEKSDREPGISKTAPSRPRRPVRPRRRRPS